MTLLTLCQKVADETGFNRPSSIVTATDQLARQLLALANETIAELCEDHDWPALRVPATINTVNGQASYTFPSDYARLVPEALWDNGANTPLRGAESATEWSVPSTYLYPVYGHRFRIFQTPLKLFIDPVPVSVQALYYEYITSKPVVQDDGTASTEFTRDTDTSKVSERLVRMGLKWRIKHAKGMDYAEDFNKYEKSRKDMYSKALALGSIPISSRPSSELTEPYVPTQGFG